MLEFRNSSDAAIASESSSFDSLNAAAAWQGFDLGVQAPAGTDHLRVYLDCAIGGSVDVCYSDVSVRRPT